MYDDINLKCLFEGCDKRPTFVLEWKMPLLCLRPLRRGMIDIINKKFLFEGFDKRPAFGLGWKKAFHRSIHPEGAMIYVVNKNYLKDVIKTIIRS